MLFFGSPGESMALKYRLRSISRPVEMRNRSVTKLHPLRSYGMSLTVKYYGCVS